jgi:asparaginyl-tRNA synthetase
VRTNTFGAVARVRNRMAFAIHQFFQERGFYYVHTPIITASDAEGAGAMFQVTTLDLEALAKSGKPVDYEKDFFGKRAYLTVSGQLNVETYCQALSRVYTFGPTFRAENSNTTRHLAEFWMIEPEMAFVELPEDIALATEFIQFLVSTALKDCAEDITFFDQRVQPGLRESLEKVARTPFTHMTYTDAVRELEASHAEFEFKPYWGCDLQSEHEKFITEKIVRGPVVVTDYPKEIKAFYMKQHGDGKTVAAMDVLVPRFGEIIGGSEREWRLDLLEKRIEELNLSKEAYGWYLDLRRFGSTPHSGFGLGFERLLMFVTGMTNIRDVIPTRERRARPTLSGDIDEEKLRRCAPERIFHAPDNRGHSSYSLPFRAFRPFSNEIEPFGSPSRTTPLNARPLFSSMPPQEQSCTKKRRPSRCLPPAWQNSSPSTSSWRKLRPEGFLRTNSSKSTQKTVRPTYLMARPSCICSRG